MEKIVMIATPAHNNKVDIPYALSLAKTINLLLNNNINIIPYITSTGSLLVAERNKIIEFFWNSEATHLLCIDSDLGWPAEAVMAMLEQDKEFIAGVYPARDPTGQEKSFLFRPCLNENGSVITEKHLLKMEYIPAGFMLLSRDAIRKMRDNFPELKFEPKNKDNIYNPHFGYLFFNTELYDGEFWGEDFVFCRRARESGIDIWVDPLIQFDHAGTIGMLLSVLSQSATEFKPLEPVVQEKKAA